MIAIYDHCLSCWKSSDSAFCGAGCEHDHREGIVSWVDRAVNAAIRIEALKKERAELRQDLVCIGVAAADHEDETIRGMVHEALWGSRSTSAKAGDGSST